MMSISTGTSHVIRMTGAGEIFANKISLAAGIAANDLSSDTTLGDNSQTALPTEYAVKQYVDSKVAAGGADILRDGQPAQQARRRSR